MVQKEFYNQAQTSGIRKYYRVITDKPNYSVVKSDYYSLANSNATSGMYWPHYGLCVEN